MLERETLENVKLEKELGTLTLEGPLDAEESTEEVLFDTDDVLDDEEAVHCESRLHTLSPKTQSSVHETSFSHGSQWKL